MGIGDLNENASNIYIPNEDKRKISNNSSRLQKLLHITNGKEILFSRKGMLTNICGQLNI